MEIQRVLNQIVLKLNGKTIEVISPEEAFALAEELEKQAEIVLRNV